MCSSDLRTQLCDGAHTWNYAYLGRVAEKQSRVTGRIYTKCTDGQLRTAPSEKGVYPVVPAKERLCLKKSSVNTVQQRFGDLMSKGSTFTQKLLDKTIKSERMSRPMTHVIVRATAGMRDEETGERDMDRIRWPDVVTGVRQYFEHTSGSMTLVHRRSNFHGMKVMPDEMEGEYAHLALQTIASSCDSELCSLIQQKAKAGKLVSMEQGGGSLQIFAGQDMENGAYPNETGLYSNLGDKYIAEELGKDSKCLSPYKKDADYASAVSPWNRDACRKELLNADIHRHHTKSTALMPALLDGGLYVAFATFFWSARRMGLTDFGKQPVWAVDEALAKVKAFFADNDSSKPDNCHDGWKMTPGDYHERLCLQAMTLEMILQKMVDNSPEANAQIVFLKELDGKDISWAIGVAESIKHKVANGQQVLVVDVGSSSTTLLGLTKTDGEFGAVEKWAKNKDGNLLEVTKATTEKRLLIDALRQ